MGRKRILTDEERKEHKRESNARWRAKNPNYLREHKDDWNAYQRKRLYRIRMANAMKEYESEVKT